MIRLSDSVAIRVPPSRLRAWLETLPEHYMQWHPDHISASWVKGEAFVPGAQMEIVERLHGKRHCLHLTVTTVEVQRKLCYRIYRGVYGSFELQPENGGCRFTASIELGLHNPLLAGMIDGLFRRLFSSRIEALRLHQIEEGRNLKRLLEAESLEV